MTALQRQFHIPRSNQLRNVRVNLFACINLWAKSKLYAMISSLLPRNYTATRRFSRMAKKHESFYRQHFCAFRLSQTIGAPHIRKMLSGRMLPSTLGEGEVNEPRLHVFVPVAKSTCCSRNRELQYCIDNNRKLVSSFRLLSEDLRVISDYPDITIHSKGRPTFYDWLQICKTLPEGDISVLANADILFDDTIGKLRNFFLKDNSTVVALSRFEYNYDQNLILPPRNAKMSQDLWALMVDNGKVNRCGDEFRIHVGEQGCDNRVAFLFWERGFQIANPMFDISVIHLHQDGRKTYSLGDCRLEGGMIKIWPSYLSGSRSETEVWEYRISS